MWTDVNNLLTDFDVGKDQNHKIVLEPSGSLAAASFRKNAGKKTRDFMFIFGGGASAYCTQCKRFQPWTCFNQRKLKGKNGEGTVVGYFRCTMLASEEGTKNKTVDVVYEETQEKRYSTCMACGRQKKLKTKT